MLPTMDPMTAKLPAETGRRLTYFTMCPVNTTARTIFAQFNTAGVVSTVFLSRISSFLATVAREGHDLSYAVIFSHYLSIY